MINFELDNTKEGLSIYLNKEGVDELIGYLNYIKEKEDHIHLIIGNELSENIIDQNNSLIRHVKIGYISGD